MCILISHVASALFPMQTHTAALPLDPAGGILSPRPYGATGYIFFGFVVKKL